MLLPSTFQAEFRPMRGAEVSALANAPDSSIQDSIAAMLASCWVRTTDPGPYAHADGDATPQFDKFLSGDLVFALLAFAVENVPNGDMYKFGVQCPRKHPNRQYAWSVNLKTQLLYPPDPVDGEPPPAVVAVRRLTPSAVKMLRDNANRFPDTIDGKRVVFKLQTPADARITKELLKAFPGVKEFTPAEVCAIQCVEVEGLKQNTIRERYNFFREASSTGLYGLFERMQAADCGIDTGIETRCPVCEWESKIDLPFEGLYSPRR